MVAEAEEDHPARGKFFRLIDRVAVALLLMLDGETDAVLEIVHPAGLGFEGWIFSDALEVGVVLAFEVGVVGTLEIVANGPVVAWLDDDADLLDAGGGQLQEVVMDEGAGDAVRA